jgi:hypothetical protein
MVDKLIVVGGGSQKPEETDPSSAVVPWVMVASVAALGTVGTVAGTVHRSSGSVVGLLGGFFVGPMMEDWDRRGYSLAQ